MYRDVKSLVELNAFASEVLGNIEPSDEEASVLALSGNLGAGKTAFVQQIGKILGVKEQITSPTYVILKNYATGSGTKFEKLIHMDAYRLESAEELEVLGWSEYLKSPNTLICIEWPENVGSAVPESATKINFKYIDENTRKVNIEKHE